MDEVLIRDIKYRKYKSKERKRNKLKRSDFGAWKYPNRPELTLKGLLPDFKPQEKTWT